MQKLKPDFEILLKALLAWSLLLATCGHNERVLHASCFGKKRELTRMLGWEGARHTSQRYVTSQKDFDYY